MQSGALFYKYDATSYTSTVYDFRVNGSSPYVDYSTYIVGGKWIDNWENTGSTYVSQHFQRNEIWYSGNYSSGPYGCHLKIARNMLQTEENIRYYYNNQGSIIVNSGFRTWVDNITTSGSIKRSMHSRGRAMDVRCSTTNGTINLYNSVKAEFAGPDHTVPEIKYSNMYYSYVCGTSYDLSKGYAMEIMPHNGSYWVHLEVAPRYDTCNY